MKAIKIYNILLGCVLALGLSSCVETAPEYVPGEKAASSSVVSADITAPVTIELDGSPIAAPFTRSDASSAVTVNVSLSDDSGLFSLQATLFHLQVAKRLRMPMSITIMTSLIHRALTRLTLL